MILLKDSIAEEILTFLDKCEGTVHCEDSHVYMYNIHVHVYPHFTIHSLIHTSAWRCSSDGGAASSARHSS